ncbi:hypothetical protein SFR_3216 [Streptomyces sp. FR-008]|nr:hypothetical protein SFR_3216 [Streptomyces sp. FR-008]
MPFRDCPIGPGGAGQGVPRAASRRLGGAVLLARPGLRPGGGDRGARGSSGGGGPLRRVHQHPSVGRDEEREAACVQGLDAGAFRGVRGGVLAGGAAGGAGHQLAAGARFGVGEAEAVAEFVGGYAGLVVALGHGLAAEFHPGRAAGVDGAEGGLGPAAGGDDLDLGAGAGGGLDELDVADGGVPVGDPGGDGRLPAGGAAVVVAEGHRGGREVRGRGGGGGRVGGRGGGQGEGRGGAGRLEPSGVQHGCGCPFSQGGSAPRRAKGPLPLPLHGHAPVSDYGRKRTPGDTGAASVPWRHADATHPELDPHRGAVAGHHGPGAGRRGPGPGRGAGPERGGHLHRVRHSRLPGRGRQPEPAHPHDLPGLHRRPRRPPPVLGPQPPRLADLRPGPAQRRAPGGGSVRAARSALRRDHPERRRAAPGRGERGRRRPARAPGPGRLPELRRLQRPP